MACFPCVSRTVFAQEGDKRVGCGPDSKGLTIGGEMRPVAIAASLAGMQLEGAATPRNERFVTLAVGHDKGTAVCLSGTATRVGPVPIAPRITPGEARP